MSSSRGRQLPTECFVSCTSSSSYSECRAAPFARRHRPTLGRFALVNATVRKIITKTPGGKPSGRVALAGDAGTRWLKFKCLKGCSPWPHCLVRGSNGSRTLSIAERDGRSESALKPGGMT